MYLQNMVLTDGELIAAEESCEPVIEYNIKARSLATIFVERCCIDKRIQTLIGTDIHSNTVVKQVMGIARSTDFILLLSPYVYKLLTAKKGGETHHFIDLNTFSTYVYYCANNRKRGKTNKKR